MTSGDTIGRLCRLNLFVFQPTKFETLFLETGLKKATTATAAIIIGSVGFHVDKIFFSYNRLDHKPQIFRNGIAITFSNDLAGILNRKLDL